MPAQDGMLSHRRDPRPLPVKWEAVVHIKVTEDFLSFCCRDVAKTFVLKTVLGHTGIRNTGAVVSITSNHLAKTFMYLLRPYMDVLI